MFDFDKISFTEIKDLCICAQTAATTRFGDAAFKQYMSSIITHVRQFYICNQHSEYRNVSVCVLVVCKQSYYLGHC